MDAGDVSPVIVEPARELGSAVGRAKGGRRRSARRTRGTSKHRLHAVRWAPDRRGPTTIMPCEATTSCAFESRGFPG